MAVKVAPLTFHSCHLLVKFIPVQSSKIFFLFLVGCFILSTCLVLFLIIIVSGNLIPGFQISEWDKHFSHSYYGCLYSLFLLACKSFKKINQPKPNLWTGEHSIREVEWLIWSLTMLCPGQERILIKRSVSTWLRFQAHWELKYSKSLLKKRKTTYYSLG